MKIAVVGNGAGSLHFKNGRFIDSCDLVIRINDYQTVGFEDAVGARTDIHMLNSCAKIPGLTATHISALREVWFAFPNPATWQDSYTIHSPYEFQYLDQWRKDLSAEEHEVDAHGAAVSHVFPNAFRRYFKREHMLELVTALGFQRSGVLAGPDGKLVQPTTGVKTIWLAKALHPGSEILVTGFDGFQSSTYYWNISAPDRYDNHAYSLEIEWLNRLCQDKVILRLD
ncbi:MAG: hypothetical protein EOR16_34020 [Mesorhizobium sp.]|uniref:glycosyltransferase family 29 protein n=1 Tax=Mesorhizobium sp. TaxID=1871066 RepID=UPI000FE9B9D5|nr:glycosyltransferase family 29 protein [Mesorhizobium sp.]RWI47921.1 MAG: hypothetical protein EOR16_34020 [Mesorhizobium sp.]TJV29047.1 MAG: hypothetical protein E5X87_33925 [Mesorhizobium sp.]TJW49903.1 MAG: hypothetical protein E5X59_10235 [Mesorhizobium sp.]